MEVRTDRPPALECLSTIYIEGAASCTEVNKDLYTTSFEDANKAKKEATRSRTSCASAATRDGAKQWTARSSGRAGTSRRSMAGPS